MANVWLNMAVSLMIAASVVIWIFVVAQWGQGRPVIAYRPRAAGAVGRRPYFLRGCRLPRTV